MKEVEMIHNLRLQECNLDRLAKMPRDMGPKVVQ
jgi:hypothetical protein